MAQSQQHPALELAEKIQTKLAGISADLDALEPLTMDPSITGGHPDYDDISTAVYRLRVEMEELAAGPANMFEVLSEREI